MTRGQVKSQETVSLKRLWPSLSLVIRFPWPLDIEYWGLIHLKDTCAGGYREESPRPPRFPKPAAESRSVGGARPREATGHRPSAVPPFAARAIIWAAGGRRGGERKRKRPLLPPPSSPLRLDRGPGRKRRDASAAVAGAFSWPRRRTGPPLCGWLQGFRGGRGTLRHRRFRRASTSMPAGTLPAQVSFSRMSRIGYWAFDFTGPPGEGRRRVLRARAAILAGRDAAVGGAPCQPDSLAARSFRGRSPKSRLRIRLGE